MPAELAHNLKETPQAVFVCQQRWQGASHNPFVLHVYVHTYLYMYRGSSIDWQMFYRNQ